MMTAFNLINISIYVIHLYHPTGWSIHHTVTVCGGGICIVRAPKIYAFSKFPVYNIVLLTIATMLYTGPLELIHPT